MIKFVRIFLLVLIIIGVGLLLTQGLWVPKLVNAILSHENSPRVIYPVRYTATTTPPSAARPEDSFTISSSTIPGWKTFTDKTFGFSISFPAAFTPIDTKEDFVSSSEMFGSPTQNTEVYQDCNGVIDAPGSSKYCSGTVFSQFDINTSNRIVDQALIKSWGNEIATSSEVIYNGKPLWEVVDCAATGCSVSFTYNGSNSSVGFGFSGTGLLDKSAPSNVYALTALGKQILNTFTVQ